MPQSPIQNKIGMIFIPVTDMDRAIAWYSQLLGVPVGSATHEGKIYNLPMQGETGLILDGNKPVPNSSQPICFFWATDISATYVFLREIGAEIVSAVEDIGSVTYVSFRDPDNNLLMVCQANN
ncbi:MAG: VOC family protein [Chloroflexi bacterium]|nr:VOC family protein [Chloroflexota bacterium]